MVLLSFSCELHIIFFYKFAVRCPHSESRNTRISVHSNRARYIFLFRSAFLVCVHVVQIESGYNEIKMNEAEREKNPIRYQVNGSQMPGISTVHACMSAKRASFFFAAQENIFHPENVSQIKVDRYLLIYL